MTRSFRASGGPSRAAGVAARPRRRSLRSRPRRRVRDMSRKRPRPGAEPLGLRRRRGGGPAEADTPGGAADARLLGGGAPPGGPPRPGSARAAVAELGRLFPRGLFEDALPPIALRSQVYSLVPDRTAADRQLVRARRPVRTPAGSAELGKHRPDVCSLMTL